MAWPGDTRNAERPTQSKLLTRLLGCGAQRLHLEPLLGKSRVLREWDTEELCFVGKGNYEKQGEFQAQ